MQQQTITYKERRGCESSRRLEVIEGTPKKQEEGKGDIEEEDLFDVIESDTKKKIATLMVTYAYNTYNLL